MSEDNRPICPIPYLGYCVYQRCNFWDEVRQECSAVCLGDYTPLDKVYESFPDSPCIIHWIEDFD